MNPSKFLLAILVITTMGTADARKTTNSLSLLPHPLTGNDRIHRLHEILEISGPNQDIRTNVFLNMEGL